jgi:uncharacterized membrane protein
MNEHENSDNEEAAKESTASNNFENNSKNVDNSRAMAILSYIGILVIIPILVAKDSKFVMYHANQGLILLIAWIILTAVNIIPILGQIIWFLGSIVLLVFMVMGILNAAKEKQKPLPIIGGFKLLN